jgi:TATA-binding protein-associated factor
LEVKKARKEALDRLGLNFIDSFGGEDDMDLEKELADAEPDLDVEMENSLRIGDNPPLLSPTDSSVNTTRKERSMSRSDSISPATPTSTTPTLPQPDIALSARERNRLKRKRKVGSMAFVAAPPPQNSGAKYTASAAGPSNK